MLFLTRDEPKRSAPTVITSPFRANGLCLMYSCELTYLFLSVILVNSQHCDVSSPHVIVMHLQFANYGAHIAALALGLKIYPGEMLGKK